MFDLVGRPKKLTAVLETQFADITVEETAQTIANTAPGTAMAIGSRENGGLVAITTIGGTPHDPAHARSTSSAPAVP